RGVVRRGGRSPGMSHIQRGRVKRRLGLIAVLLALFSVVLAPAAMSDPSPSPSASAPAAAPPNLNQKPKDGSDGLLQPFHVTDKDGVQIGRASCRERV